MRVAGIVLAAGAGTRMGRPKGMLADAQGVPWVRLAETALADAGCAPVLVVTGAGFEDVEPLVPPEAVVVRTAGWTEGMGASLRAGLTALRDRVEPLDAAVVALVDMPDVSAAVVARLLAAACEGSASAAARLARVTYQGRPGHPVLLGRAHWDGVIAAAQGDRGARKYLREREDVLLVEAGDLASGVDIDTPPAP